jgi:hypothetical protein
MKERKIKSVILKAGWQYLDYKNSVIRVTNGDIQLSRFDSDYWFKPKVIEISISEKVILNNQKYFIIEYEKEEFEKGDIVKTDSGKYVLVTGKGTAKYDSFAGVMITDYKDCSGQKMFGEYSTTWNTCSFKKTDNKIVICTNFK